MRRLLALALLSAPVAIGAAGVPVAHADGDHSTRVMLLVDASASMSGQTGGGITRMEAASRAVSGAAARLGPREEVGLQVYGSGQAAGCDDTRVLLAPRVGTEAKLRDALVPSSPPASRGESPLGPALQRAGEALGSRGPRAIVLVAHGAPTCDPDPVVAAAQLTASDPDLRIHVIGVDVTGAQRDTLRRVAAAGDGVYRDAHGAAALAEAVDGTLTRATQVFLGGGIPAAGGDSAAESTEVRSGTWFDTLGAQGTGHAEGWFVFERVLAESTLHVHASVRIPEDPAHVGDEVGLEIEAFAGERSCGSATARGTASTDAIVSAYLPVPDLADGDEGCRDARRLGVVVRRTDQAGVPALPVEMYAAEEAPAPDEPLTPVAADGEGARVALISPGAVQAGAPTFAQAPELAEGAHRGLIVPGETQVFRVPVGWGQRLGAAVQFPAGEGVTGSIRVISPNRAGVVDQQETSAGSVEVHTPTVAYGNRTSSTASVAAANVAGDYYVLVSASAADTMSRAEVPFVLGVAVSGKEQPRPAYRGALVPSAETGTGTASEATDGGKARIGWIAALAVVFGLGAGAAAWFGTRRS
ncbi:VWA domain-containing protein [Nocardioides cavernaquae]|nr:VWA domain-containing protein [Nocardioides cavernaquae]